MQHHVFLSYSRVDEAIMQRVRAGLEAEGLRVWIDRKGIRPGDPDWSRVIQSAIENAGCVVVLFSPEAKNSEWVNEELGYAKQQKKQVFPALVRGEEDNSLPFGYSRAQYVDLRSHWNFAAAITQLAEEVCKDVGIEPPSVRRARQRTAEVQMAVNLQRDRKYEEARRYLRKLVEKDPQHDEAWFQLALLAPKETEYLEALEKVLEVNPAHAPARERRDELYRKKEQEREREEQRAERREMLFRLIKPLVILSIVGCVIVGAAGGGYIYLRAYVEDSQAPLCTALLSPLDERVKGIPNFATSQIAYSMNEGEGEEVDVYVFDLATGETLQLTSDESNDEVASWSPDGQYIAYESDQTGNEEIFRMETNGQNPINLTQTSRHDSGPIWSPDGTTIAWEVFQNDVSSVYLMNADGSQARQLVTLPEGIVPTGWSPDSTSLLAVSLQDDGWTLYRVQIDSGALTALVTGVNGPPHARWSPDGTTIAYIDDNLYTTLIDADGSNPRPLSTDFQSLGPPVWLPDSRHLLVWTSVKGPWSIPIVERDEHTALITTAGEVVCSFGKDPFALADWWSPNP